MSLSWSGPPSVRRKAKEFAPGLITWDQGKPALNLPLP